MNFEIMFLISLNASKILLQQYLLLYIIQKSFYFILRIQYDWSLTPY